MCAEQLESYGYKFEAQRNFEKKVYQKFVGARKDSNWFKSRESTFLGHTAELLPVAQQYD